jgi:hypothetical protein
VGLRSLHFPGTLGSLPWAKADRTDCISEARLLTDFWRGAAEGRSGRGLRGHQGQACPLSDSGHVSVTSPPRRQVLPTLGLLPLVPSASDVPSLWAHHRLVCVPCVLHMTVFLTKRAPSPPEPRATQKCGTLHVSSFEVECTVIFIDFSLTIKI